MFNETSDLQWREPSSGRKPSETRGAQPVVDPNQGEKKMTEPVAMQGVVSVPSKPLVAPRGITVCAPKIPAQVHVAILIDATGSSGPFAQGICRTSEHILRGVEAKAAKVVCTVQIHRDEDYGQMPCTLLSAGSVAEALDEIGRISFEGGGVAEETHAAAVLRALNSVAWIANSRMAHDAMVLMTSSESKPVAGVSFSDIGKRIQQQGILFYHVGEPTPNLKAMTDAAKGMTIPLSNNPDAGECACVAAKCAASITASVSRGATVPVTA